MFKSLKLVATFGLLFGLSACGDSEVITVGASSTPHAKILEEAKEYLSGKGYDLKIRVFDDYVLPNYALENGELDANYFQHKPYLEEFNKANNTHLVPVLDVHFEPMGIYGGKKHDLKSFSYADSVLIPSDKSNYDRAVELLKVNNFKDANIIPVEAQNIPLMLSDCDYAVINGNYALSAGVVDKCLVTEDRTSDIAKKMANVIAVKEGNESTKKTTALVDALKQNNIKKYIESTFGSSVIYMA